MRQFILLLLFLLTYCANGFSQTKQTVKWQKVSDDEIVTISYNPNITKTKSGNHVVWVKAEYHTSEWQWYFAEQVGLRAPIYTTKTKVWYDENYNYCMVRQILLFNKAGKQVYNSGDYVQHNYIDTIMNEARLYNADIVQSGYNRVTPERQLFSKHPRKDLRFEATSPILYFENISGFLWAGVIRKSLFENLRFGEKFWYEDMMTRMLVARRANRVSILKDCLYNYTVNPNSLSTMTWDSHNIKCADQPVLAIKMLEYGLNKLNLHVDEAGYNILIKEMGVMTSNRIKYQNKSIQKKMFVLMSSYIQSLNYSGVLYTKDNKIIHEALKDGNFNKWLYFCKSKRYS